MNFIKIILIAIGLVLAAMLAFSVIGIVYSALWYLFLLGIVAVGGAIGYKLLMKEDVPLINETSMFSAVKSAELFCAKVTTFCLFVFNSLANLAPYSSSMLTTLDTGFSPKRPSKSFFFAA